MSRSSDSGQVEPIAALVAVFAVCVGVTLYVGVLDDHLPIETDRALEETAADRLVAEASSDGVVEPPVPTAARAATPTGYRLNATVRADDRTWASGPTPPADVTRAERRVPVRVEPGVVRPGRLEVRLWDAE